MAPESDELVELAGIRTERLLLRRVTPDDLNDVLEVHQDPETQQYNLDGPPSDEQAAEILRAWLTDWTEQGIGYWAVVLVETGQVVGFGGLAPREINDEPALNLYYRFRPSAWGKGDAAEMAAAAVRWAELAMPERPVSIVTHANNTPALRLAERLGFVQVGLTEYGGQGPTPLLRRAG